jgi:hypothetical protein
VSKRTDETEVLRARVAELEKIAEAANALAEAVEESLPKTGSRNVMEALGAAAAICGKLVALRMAQGVSQ